MRRPKLAFWPGRPPEAPKPAPPAKPPKVILHAGTHKTGTTGIQFALSENRPYLRSVGVWYPRTDEFFPVNPKLPSARAHLAFANAVAEFARRDRKKLSRFLGAIHKRSAQVDRVILSAEAMYRRGADAPLGNAEETELEKRARYLDRLAAILCGFDTEVLLYLRRVDRFAASLYAEAIVRSNSMASFQDFLSAKQPRFDYRGQIDLLAMYFPLQVHNFEAAAKAGLIETFCKHAGIPGKLPDTPDRPRPSVSNAAALWLLREKRAREMAKLERRRRWHFALLPENAELFQTGVKTGFWTDAAERDAFIETYQSKVSEVSFPAVASEVEPLASWSDAQHRDAERQFLAWQAVNEEMLKNREHNKIPPHALDG